VFSRARGSRIWSNEREYLDFFSGAGSLNYGHNDPCAQRALVDYLSEDGILQSLDMQTDARLEFLRELYDLVLGPRDLAGYRAMFTGPTGTNAIEAALKCARLATGRTRALAFTGGFHGVSLGSLALSSNGAKRSAAGVPLTDATLVPFDSPSQEPGEALDWLERAHFLECPESERPACVVMELVQGEGGVHVASREWAQGVELICHRYGVPLIVDEIQTGCGRTGRFFSFEHYDLRPDMVTLSKSLSGIGLPLSILLVDPAYDLQDGQHNGTFRGNNAAFVTATACLRKYWSDDVLAQRTRDREDLVTNILVDSGIADRFQVRGKGQLLGIDLGAADVTAWVASELFAAGILVETAGDRGQVLKLLPALTMESEDLNKGVTAIADVILRVCRESTAF